MQDKNKATYVLLFLSEILTFIKHSTQMVVFYLPLPFFFASLAPKIVRSVPILPLLDAPNHVPPSPPGTISTPKNT